jgi:hypothetical protein
MCSDMFNRGSIRSTINQAPFVYGMSLMTITHNQLNTN